MITIYRRVLCLDHSGTISPAMLVTMVKQLARALAEHLNAYAVVVEPGGGTNFYKPGSVTNLGTLGTMNDVMLQADIAYGAPVDPIMVHFLVIDHPLLDPFLAGTGTTFDVVTPFISYADRFLPLSPTITSRVSTGGRAMPAIILPSSTSGNAGAVKFYAIDEGWNAPNPPERDSCRMRFTPPQVNAAAAEPTWANVHPATKATFERWARTVAWKRVGLSISGGGASVFRLVPLFEALEAKGLPIDLMTGVSGGTIFSACYALGGLPKVQELANRGSSFMVALLGGLVTSWFVQRYVDDFLHNCGLCNTEIRVLPITARIAPMSPPQANAVVDGTFGEALRASGGAPFFGPYFVGNARQTDGAVLAGLPPPFLAERFGADIVFAMNVLALPANRFPGETIPIFGDIVSVFYRYTPLGRVIDTVGATTTMLHTISEGAGLQADVFVDTPPRDWGPIEQFLLYNSTTYSNIGLGPGVDTMAVAQDCVQLWQALP